MDAGLNLVAATLKIHTDKCLNTRFHHSIHDSNCNFQTTIDLLLIAFSPSLLLPLFLNLFDFRSGITCKMLGTLPKMTKCQTSYCEMCRKYSNSEEDLRFGFYPNF